MCLFCTTHQKQTAAEAEALQVEVASWVTAAREGVLQQFDQVCTQVLSLHYSDATAVRL
jgi:hypothetical protein